MSNERPNYQSNPHENNGEPEFDRRELFKKIAIGLGGGIVTGVISDIIVQHLPDIGRVIGSIKLPEFPTPEPTSTEAPTEAPKSTQTPEPTVTLEPWVKNPIESYAPKVFYGNEGDALNATITIPANTLACILFVNKDPNASVIAGGKWFVISANSKGSDANLTLYVGPESVGSHLITPVEIYKPIGRPIDSWHMLLQKKKLDLIAILGKDDDLRVSVQEEYNSSEPNFGDRNIFDQYYKHLTDIS